MPRGRWFDSTLSDSTEPPATDQDRDPHEAEPMPQTQTPTRFHKPGRLRDYTPTAADVYCGDVVVIGNRCFVAAADIAYATTSTLGLNGTPTRGALHADGEHAMPKDASTFADGDPVYWVPTGNPTGGTAGTGAASSAAAGGTFAGYAVVEDGTSVLTGDAAVIVDITAPKHRETINADVAAAGSAQGDAAQVYEGFTVVTGADATKGVILPTAVPGMRVIIKGTTAAVLKVYPKTGAAINAIAANGAISLASLAPALFIAKTATQWYTVPLLPS